ncbi:MAG: hypothetical protein GEU97_21200 [Actinophytocola sp.]|nr:hypothetical protein [Actinophytocola sp.]
MRIGPGARNVQLDVAAPDSDRDPAGSTPTIAEIRDVGTGGIGMAVLAQDRSGDVLEPAGSHEIVFRRPRAG